MHKAVVALSFLIFINDICPAQSGSGNKQYSRADTLRGSITPERAWWNVLRYDITVKPDFVNKTIEGKNNITYKVIANDHPSLMQIDLKEPLHIDSILFNTGQKLNFKREANVWLIEIPSQDRYSTHNINIYYSGKPREAVRAPWDGGWTFTKDSLGRPWMTVTCQGLGASVWYPCKDHQSDEPDSGASLTMIVPDTLVAVGNGRLQWKKNNADGTSTFKWAVINPINNYNIIPYIGKYVNFKEVYKGEKGNLDLNYWVLDYNLPKAKTYMPIEVHNTLKSFEHWFGPYPFYEDGYQLIDVPHTGMEHQSAVAYGNLYKPGYRGRDGSGTGWGMKWDFIIVHETGHEWFGNNISTKDLADMWVHEGFTNYSETLFIDYIFGKEAANEYNAGTRRGIRNDKPVIPDYNVNAQGSGDMYPKAGNMLHTIRHSIDNDQLFRSILKGLNKTYYHQAVTSSQIEKYISQHAKYDYSKVFDQYLRTTNIPRLQLRISKNQNSVSCRWVNCVPGFNLPIILGNGSNRLKIIPSEQWQSTDLKENQASLLTVTSLEKMYYITVEMLPEEK